MIKLIKHYKKGRCWLCAICNCKFDTRDDTVKHISTLHTTELIKFLESKKGINETK